MSGSSGTDAAALQVEDAHVPQFGSGSIGELYMKLVTVLVVSEILPFVVLANRSKSTFYKILYHETKF